MNKIMNDPVNYDKEVADGFIKAFGSDLLFPKGDLSAVIRKVKPETAEVAVIGVCDGGHMPVFAGYVGKGMLHGASVGRTFEVPESEDILSVIVNCQMGKGAVIIPLIWNEKMSDAIRSAAASAERKGIKVAIAEIRDDCLQPRNDPELRKSSAGIFFACKIAGAAAEEKKDIDEITAILERVNDNTRTASDVGTSFCLPDSREPFMQIDEGKMQVGVGLHGEPGFEMVDYPRGYEIAEHLFRHRLNAELNIRPKDPVAIMINDTGSCTLDELLIIYQEEARQFEAKGAEIIRPFIGRFVTTLDMDGVSISAIRLDSEMKNCLLAPAYTPFFKQ